MKLICILLIIMGAFLISVSLRMPQSFYENESKRKVSRKKQREQDKETGIKTE